MLRQVFPTLGHPHAIVLDQVKGVLFHLRLLLTVFLLAYAPVQVQINIEADPEPAPTPDLEDTDLEDPADEEGVI